MTVFYYCILYNLYFFTKNTQRPKNLFRRFLRLLTRILFSQLTSTTPVRFSKANVVMVSVSESGVKPKCWVAYSSCRLWSGADLVTNIFKKNHNSVPFWAKQNNTSSSVLVVPCCIVISTTPNRSKGVAQWGSGHTCAGVASRSMGKAGR